MSLFDDYAKLPITPSMSVRYLLQFLEQSEFPIAESALGVPRWFASKDNRGPCTLSPDWPQFWPACALHDWLYWLGGPEADGRERRRLRRLYDRLFYAIAKHNAEYFGTGRRAGPVSRRFRRVAAVLYLRGIRFGRSLGFTVEKRPARLNPFKMSDGELHAIAKREGFIKKKRG